MQCNLLSDVLFPGDFLSILSEIERNYLYVFSLVGSSPQLTLFTFLVRLDDDRDATSNGDGMTLLSNN